MFIIRKKRIPSWILLFLTVCLLCAGCGNVGTAGSTEGQPQTEETERVSEWLKETETAGLNPDGTDRETETDALASDAVDRETETDALPSDAVDRETETDALASDAVDKETDENGLEAGVPEETGNYTSRDEVALYIHMFGHLPDNFITKKEAQALGWDNARGNLADVAPGKSIGGDRFGNYEGLLPDAKGRRWTECDIDYESGYRNACRIIFSNDGLIYYTDDHYKSFVQLY